MSEPKVHWKKVHNPDYLGSWSFQPNEEKTVEIIKVEERDIIGNGGKKSKCNVAILKDQKPMIVNKINSKILSRLYGSPYIGDWHGKSITLYVDPKVESYGEITEGIRIKPIKPPLPELTPSHPKWNEAIKAVKADPKAIDKITARFTVSNDNLKKLKS